MKHGDKIVSNNLSKKLSLTMSLYFCQKTLKKCETREFFGWLFNLSLCYFRFSGWEEKVFIYQSGTNDNFTRIRIEYLRLHV